MSQASNNSSRSSADRTAAQRGTGASAAHLETPHDDQTTKESFIGTDRGRRMSNVSWGAIFAGVVTFIALMVVLNIMSAALGLSGAGATWVGVWTVISLVISLAAAGYVAGALAVSGGLLHGFLTWAVSLLAILVLIGWLGSSILGTLGGALGSVASQVDVSSEQVSQATDVASEAAASADPNAVQDTVQNAAGQVADTAESAAWWGFAGLLLGGVIASLAGAAGARSVNNKREDVVTVERR